MRGAWLVRTIVVALVLMLFGKMFGVALSAYAFVTALAIAAAIMLGIDRVRRWYIDPTK